MSQLFSSICKKGILVFMCGSSLILHPTYISAANLQNNNTLEVEGELLQEDPSLFSVYAITYLCALTKIENKLSIDILFEGTSSVIKADFVIELQKKGSNGYTTVATWNKQAMVNFLKTVIEYTPSSKGTYRYIVTSTIKDSYGNKEISTEQSNIVEY